MYGEGGKGKYGEIYAPVILKSGQVFEEAAPLVDYVTMNCTEGQTASAYTN